MIITPERNPSVTSGRKKIMKKLNDRFKIASSLSIALILNASASLPIFAQNAEPVRSEQAAASPNSPGQNVGGIIYGKDHAYMLSAPKGWVLDNQAGKEQGLVAVFYPKDGSWAESPSVMYTRVQPKSGKTFAEAIKTDIDYMKKSSPMIVATEQEPIVYGKEKKRAEVRYLSADKNSNCEAVAYMEEKNCIVLVILTARNEEDFKGCFPAFKELVESYVFMTDKVKI